MCLKGCHRSGRLFRVDQADRGKVVLLHMPRQCDWSVATDGRPTVTRAFLAVCQDISTVLSKPEERVYDKADEN